MGNFRVHPAMLSSTSDVATQSLLSLRTVNFHYGVLHNTLLTLMSLIIVRLSAAATWSCVLHCYWSALRISAFPRHAQSASPDDYLGIRRI